MEALNITQNAKATGLSRTLGAHTGETVASSSFAFLTLKRTQHSQLEPARSNHTFNIPFLIDLIIQQAYLAKVTLIINSCF